jgi:hypothetical protein
MKVIWLVILSLVISCLSFSAQAQDSQPKDAACHTMHNCLEAANVFLFATAVVVVDSLPYFFFHEDQGVLIRDSSWQFGFGGNPDGFAATTENQNLPKPELPITYHARSDVNTFEKGRRQIFSQKFFSEFRTSDRDQSFFAGPGAALSLDFDEGTKWGGYGADLGYQRRLMPQLQTRLVFDYLKFPSHEEMAAEFGLFLLPIKAGWKDFRFGFVYKKVKVGEPSATGDAYLLTVVSAP